MRTRLLVTSVLCLASAILTGCVSLSTLQTARTVPAGKVRHAVGLEVVGVSVAGSSAATAPQVEYALRVGVADNVDIGFKVYALGLEGGVKFQLVRGSFDLSLAPSAAYSSFGVNDANFSFLYLHLPILMGIHVGDVAEMGFGPKLLYALVWGSDTGGGEFTAVDGFTAGLYWNMLFKIGDFMLLGPEVNMYVPIEENAFDGVVYQGGLVMAFGGMDDDPRPEGYYPPQQ